MTNSEPASENTHHATSSANSLKDRIGKTEFIALMAFMMAIVAFTIDALLPALPFITQELTGGDEPRASLVVAVFVVGLGMGTFVMGPLSDAWGRKPIVYVGLIIYAIGSILAWIAPTIELMLAARLLQGLGASGPRTVSMTVIRDIFAGREMARISSYVMMAFLLVPGIAPLIGHGIENLLGWRMIYGSFLLFGLIILVWFSLRIPETLAPQHRIPLRAKNFRSALSELFAHPMVRLSIITQTLTLGVLFAVILQVQPLFEKGFDRGSSFPYWFGAIAVASGVSSLLNAKLVMRFGMRRLVGWVLYAQIAASAAFILFLLTAEDQTSDLVFYLYVIWQWGILFQTGVTMANLNALAMEPMGHIAGMAASMVAAISTVFAGLIALPSLFFFDATARPLVLNALLSCLVALFFVRKMRNIERATPDRKDH